MNTAVKWVIIVVSLPVFRVRDAPESSSLNRTTVCKFSAAVSTQRGRRSRKKTKRMPSSRLSAELHMEELPLFVRQLVLIKQLANNHIGAMRSNFFCNNNRPLTTLIEFTVKLRLFIDHMYPFCKEIHPHIINFGHFNYTRLIWNHVSALSSSGDCSIVPSQRINLYI